MNNVVNIFTRKPYVPLRLVTYDDVRIEFARRVEQMADEMESETARPCDTQESE